MCGVFGLVVERGSELDPSAIGPLIRELYRVSESRGKEASGLALHIESRSGIEVRKAAVPGRRLIASPAARQLLARAADAVASNLRVAILGHTRMVTNGDPSNNANNQPVVGERVVVLHNGIITNEDMLWRSEPDLTRSFEVDTELVVRLADRALAQGGQPHPQLDTVLHGVARLIEGANTLAMLDGEQGHLALGTANGSLYLAMTPPNPASPSAPTSRVVVFASEEPILRRAIDGRRPLRRRARPAFGPIRQLRPGHTLLVPGDGTLHEWGEVTFGSTQADKTGHGSSEDNPRVPSPRISEISRSLRAVAVIDEEAIVALRRCTRCVLPETFPGIRFDAAGVCSVCAAYQAPEPRGLHALQNLVSQGSTILMPLSGGRDSSYGLHLAAKELGARVVAFTYDWGMVTDLARRNISRMCGELGIEHILVSADITRKRRYIRQNILAWLRRPELGTIPLFMAGDKQFFYHAQRLRVQHKAALVMFSHNPYERTDFKSGFAGVSDAEDEKRIYYDLAAGDKLRLLAYYGRQAALNPAFLNSSLIDSASGYLSYYAIPKRYASLFDFVTWNESEVDDMIIDEYGWETSTDAATTWRIGDGTAPFYNFLYLKLAGFTENDALRSNQIRAGHITRTWALERLRAENAPRLDSMAWYFDVLGLDGAEVLRRTAKIPSLLQNRSS